MSAAAVACSHSRSVSTPPFLLVTALVVIPSLLYILCSINSQSVFVEVCEVAYSQ